MVKYSRSVNDLPSLEFVLGVTDEEILCCECVGLHLNVCTRNVVHEAGLTDVGESSHDEGTRRCVDLGQPAHVLPNLFQIAEGRFQLFEESARSSESCTLELLCSIERISVFQ